jgi:drug/metabolite transporter (DMT)-like permease
MPLISRLPVATIGALCAVGASVAFTLNDMAVKSLSGDYALHQVILIRSGLALIVTLAVIMPLTGGWGQIRSARPGLHLIRGFFIVAANVAFFTALAAMPLAEATAIFFVSPLILAALSVVILGETVGPRRWAAIGTGLIGVLIIIRPGGSAFAPVSLLPLVAAACYAATHVMTRRMGLRDSAATLAFYIQITFCMFSLAVGLVLGDGRLDTGDRGAALAFLTRAWVWPPSADWPVFLLAGLGSALGGLMISQAYRLCEAALVAPLEYVALPMAIVWGLTVFGEWPDPVAWVGMSLILGSGLYMIWRETRPRAIPIVKAP